MGLSPQIFIEQLPQVRQGSWRNEHQPGSQGYTPEGLPKGFETQNAESPEKNHFWMMRNPGKLHVGSRIWVDS